MIRGGIAVHSLAASVALVAVLAARPVSAEPAKAHRDPERARLECGVHQLCCFMASVRTDPLAPPPIRPAHRAIVGIPVIGDTGLAQPVIKHHVKRHLARLASCYPRRLPALPGAGAIGLQLVILPLGRAQLIGAAGFDAEVTSCLARAIEAIPFPRADNGDVTHVFVPIRFVATVAAPRW